MSTRLAHIMGMLKPDETLAIASDVVLRLLPWFIWPILDGYKIVMQCFLQCEQLLSSFGHEMNIETAGKV